MAENFIIHVYSDLQKLLHRVRFAQSSVSIGRNLCNDIVLASPYVSHLHGVFHWDDGAVEFVDLGSANGSRLDGKKLSPQTPYRMTKRSVLRLGKLTLRVSDRLAPGELLTSTAHSQAQGLQREVQAAMAGKPEATMLCDIRGTAEARPTSVWRRPPPEPPALAPKEITAKLSALKPLYQTYLESCGRLLTALRQSTEDLTPSQREAVFARLRQQLPMLAKEPATHTLFMNRQSSHPDRVAARALRWMAIQLSGKHVPLSASDDIATFATRVVTVAQSQARAFVGLHDGAIDFARSHAHVVPFRDDNPLAHPKAPSEVLNYLFDWEAPATPRIQALNHAYKALMAHQLGLLGGLRGSVRALLESLGPASLEATLKKKSIRIGRLSIPWRLWPLRISARWSLFQQRFKQLLNDEKLDNALLGKEFALAYTTICGRTYHKPRQRFLPVATEDLQRRDELANEDSITHERPACLQADASSSPMSSKRTIASIMIILFALLFACSPALPELETTVPVCSQRFGHLGTEDLRKIEHTTWEQVLLLQRPEAAGQPKTAPSERFFDCTGAAFSWPIQKDACGLADIEFEYPAVHPDADIQDYWPHPTGAYGLVWYHLATVASGDALGPVALVQASKNNMNVHALGSLRAFSHATAIEFIDGLQRNYILLSGYRCLDMNAENQCREEMQLLVHEGEKLFTPQLIVAATEDREGCVRPATFSRTVHYTHPPTLERFELERTLVFEDEQLFLDEQLTIRPAATSGPTQTLRQRSPLHLTGDTLVGARPSLMVQVVDLKHVSSQRVLNWTPGEF